MKCQRERPVKMHSGGTIPIPEFYAYFIHPNGVLEPFVTIFKSSIPFAKNIDASN
jgi:hypothetical protein